MELELADLVRLVVPTCLLSTIIHLWAVPLQTTTASRWARGLCGVPDVPHACVKQPTGAHDVGYDKRHPSHQSIEGFWITFTSENIKWEALFWQKKLYLQIPDEGLPEGSKEAMTELLEFAEETLKVSHVTLSFRKDRTDRVQVIRTLMYLGFDSLSPDHPLIPSDLADSAFYFMAYSNY